MTTQFPFASRTHQAASRYRLNVRGLGPQVRRLRALALIACMLSMGTAFAMQRNFPEDSKSGIVKRADAAMTVTLNGKIRNLSPGVQIKSQDNMLQQPASLQNENARAVYVENAQGEISHIWLLGPDETGPKKTQK